MINAIIEMSKFLFVETTSGVIHVKKMFLVMLFLISYLTLSRTLLLYKGSEDGYGTDVLSSYIIPVLKNLYEDYDLVDVEKELPDLSEYDLVVTCYYSSKMRNAKIYLKKLSEYVLNGGKIFVINNLGAFEDPSGDSPGLSDINALLNLIGVRYEYNWRQEDVLDLKVDQEYLLKRVTLPVRKSFDGFSIFSPTVKVLMYAVTSRGNYPVIFYGERGGMAIFEHAFDERGNAVIDLGKIVRDILLFNKTNRILLLKENTHVKKTFENALFEVDTSPRYPLSYYKGVVITEDTLLEREDVKNYIENGGSVIFLGKGTHSITGNLVLEKKHLYIPENINVGYHYVSYRPAPQDAEVFMTVDGTPVSWMVKRGKGTLVYFPPDLLEKWSRGILFNEFLVSSGLIVSPIVNVFSIFFDDFPLPSYGIKHDITGTTDEIFYYKIWWEDMKKLCKEYSMRPFTALITSYNNKPEYVGFLEFLQSRVTLDFLKTLLEAKDVNVGLHGYNHLPPLQKNWNPDELKISYKALKTFLNELSKSYVPFFFVAPNNEIDKASIEILKEIFPSIKIVGTSYLAETETSEYEIFEDVLILPRTTSGHYPVQRLLVETMSTLLNMGTFHYFTHPDDVISSNRNPESRNWEYMLGQLREFFRVIKRNYPWLRNMTPEELYDTFKDYFENKPTIVYHKDKINVILNSRAKLPRYFFLKSDQDFSIQGGELIYERNGLCVIEMKERKMEVLLNGG
ncbi:MAG: Uncharacterized protein XD57_0433 [Thermotoga petrophila]|uniref:DUF2194 domain-containing protein n=1 Tax=Thermotoga petrophila TaxID=93929 RepID=A0A117L362_9THEM|nr:MAG: Uncharacterized protein XD57_0433 [Thermotoga petrophila]